MIKPIVVVGSSNIDFIMKMDHLPARDESVPDAEFMQTFGGKGANQAVAAARAGRETYFVNCVGDDPYAETMVAGYADSGVNVGYVFREKNISSGTALVMIGEGGHNYLSVAPGANHLLTPERIDGLRDLFARAGYVLVQFEILAETVERVLEVCDEVGAPVIWNVAPAKPFEIGILKRVDILVANEPEASVVTGTTVTDEASARTAARRMCELGVGTGIVTLGENGSVIATSSSGEARAPEVFHVAAFPVEPVDTTAAGDTYCGCLAVALAEGKSLTEAVRFAGAAAAISVQKMGAQPSTPWRAEIDEFLSARA